MKQTTQSKRFIAGVATMGILVGGAISVINFPDWQAVTSDGAPRSTEAVLELVQATGFLIAPPIVGCFIGIILGFLYCLLRSLIWKNFFSGFGYDREKRLTEIRKKLRRRNAESERAQRSKPAFESRLDQFVSTNVETSHQEEPFVSKMPYWQRHSLGESTLPKPVEYIRQLLIQITKHVILGTKVSRKHSPSHAKK